MRAISKDLRNRVITYIKKGNSCASVPRRFEILDSLARLCYSRYKETRSYEAKLSLGRKPRRTESLNI